MLAIELRFPGGRYHATPWDSHVNEGGVEWPPSPWRLLRALIATWHLKARNEVPEETLRSLIDVLSGELPRYALPERVCGFHTRHYMPLFVDKTTKVFDTFLHVPRGGRVLAAWPNAVLSPSQTEAMACLVDRLGFLGRAESWVDGQLLDDIDVTPLDCEPTARTTQPIVGEFDADSGDRERITDLGELGKSKLPRDERERVRVLAPMSPAELFRWREAALDKHMTRRLEAKRDRVRDRGGPTDRITLSAKERAAVETLLPASVLEALEADTEVIRKQGWSRPPGSRWVDYLRPPLDDWSFAVSHSPQSREPLPTVARFALAGQVLPRFTDAVLEAERIRRALMSRARAAPVFSARHAVTGEILTGHQHAFIIPEANARHGHITHVTVFARMGIDDDARAALEDIRSVWQRSGHPIQLVLLGVGQRDDFGGTRSEVGECPALATSSTWVSRTPFVPTRHEKRSHSGQPRLDAHGIVIGSPEHDLIRLLREQNFPRPSRVERIPDTDLGGKRTRWLAFRTERKRGHGRRANVGGVGFRICFGQPVQGPIAVGYGAHFGLGYFVPDVAHAEE